MRSPYTAPRSARSHAGWLLAATAAVLLAACSTLGTLAQAVLGNQLALTAPQLQGFLDQRFPRDYDKAGGAVRLSLLNPRLSIPQGGTRLRLDFDVGIGMLGRDSRTPAGHFAVASGLRFEPATRGLHLADPTVEAVDIPALGGAMNATGRDLINRWLADYSRDEPVYRFDDGLFAQLGHRRIESTSIERGLVVVHFSP